MNNKEHQAHYYKEKDRVLGFYQNTQVDRDKTIVQLSVVSLTILAGFGGKVLSANYSIAVAIVTLLVTVIVVQTIGFITTERGAMEVSRNMDRNVQEGRRFFDPDHTKTTWSKTNTIINVVSISSFLCGFILIGILIIQYIGG